MFAIKTGYAWKAPLAIQIIGWGVQVLSHAFIERRAPAILDNTLQALLLAPLFVFMELLFVLGYRPALQKRIHEKVKAAISTWKLRCERRSVSADVQSSGNVERAKDD